MWRFLPISLGGKRLTIRDDLGDELSVDVPPARIVSLVPSITETLVDLGAGGRLVGITTYCVHPRRAVDKITKIGGTKGFSLEKIDDVGKLMALTVADRT